MVTDRARKAQIVMITASLGLVGFFLEVGPVAGAFSLAVLGRPVFDGLSLELQGLGFLAYLALAASAAVGLHMGEEEPRLEEEEAETPGAGKPRAAEDEGARERERAATRRAPVRPEIHQLLMITTALGGYVVLKGISLLLMWPLATAMGVGADALTRAFQFGVAFTAIGWFVLWQLLRWYAREHRWICLQQELVGVDALRAVAVVVLIKPIWFLITSLTQAPAALGLFWLFSLLLHLALVGVAVILWLARPTALRRTVTALGVAGGAIVLLTLLLGVLERAQSTL